ncbi:MAG: ATP-dependent Clp protease, protease subunit [Micromonosporaceae bacterium]|nr:ATP-dependent Clp protease, protease subunit [Micromonosporaceae bacterium]
MTFDDRPARQRPPETARHRGILAELVAHRHAAGLSQSDVAGRMGTSQPAVARVETGQVDLRLSTLRRYASAVGRRLDVRLGGPSVPVPPGHGDGGTGVGGWLEERMFGQRIVLLQGPVGSATANRVAATLLTLDALGTEPVRLQVSAPSGEMVAVFALVDAVDAMRAPVHATAIGEVGGAAVGVYAAAHRRLAYPHARFRLAEPDAEGVNGTADQVAAAAGRYLQSLEDLLVRVAAATGQPRSRIEDDFSTGRILDAAQAREYGLVHEIVAPSPR